VKVLWTKPAAEAYRSLPAPIRQEIRYRVEVLSEFPEMYPIRTHQPYAGFRYFFTTDWCVSYTVTENNLIILAVFHARRG